MPLRRSFRRLALVWKWIAHLSGFIVVSFALGFGIVQLFAGDGAVFMAEDIRPTVTKAKAGGSIAYTYNQRRFESCPGEVVQIFNRGSGRDAIIRETRRPVIYTQAQYYDDLRISVAVPSDLPPGVYHFRDGIQSRCPTRSRFDPISSFDVEVLPP